MTDIFLTLFLIINAISLSAQSLEVEGSALVSGAEGVVSPITKIGALKSDSITTTNAVIDALLANQKLHVGADGIAVDGYVTTSGWTQLGDSTEVTFPAFKIKQISGATAATEGNITTISHGLNSSKFISVSPVVIYNSVDGNGVTENYQYNDGFEFGISWDATNINIINIANNSDQILSKQVIITIMYIQ